MRIRILILSALIGLSTLSPQLSAAAPLGTAFTYQGKLAEGGNPANGNYDLRFTIYDALADGNVVGGPLTNTATVVTNGLFTVALDFGSVYDGDARWLEILVCTNGGAFTMLAPRQALTPAPYALYSPSAGVAVSAGSVAAANITGTMALAQLPATVITNNHSGVTLSGEFKALGGLVIENRTSDPPSPAAGQIWLRTDL